MDVDTSEYITGEIQFMDASASLAEIDTGPGDLCAVFLTKLTSYQLTAIIQEARKNSPNM